MNRKLHAWHVVPVATILALLLTISGTSSALAGPDKKAPTKPANLRATSVTAHNVTLAWNPSTDNSGTFSYRVWVSYGSTYTVPQTQTTFSLGLVPDNTYSFYVYAVDGSGNVSPRSNTLSVTTLPDTTPPTAPVASLGGVNPTEVLVQWSASTDDGLHILYEVYVNGVATVDAGFKLNAVVHGLSPETTYEITVVARDLYGENESPPSNVVLATTAAVSATDTQPPSAPPSLWGGDVGGLEVDLFWTESFDNQTAQASLVYEVYLDGVLEQTVGEARSVTYVGGPGEHTFDIVAVDAAGNRSAPTSITVLVQG